jgi:hypothetical protein
MKKKLYWFLGILIGFILLLAIANPTTQGLKKHIKEPTSDKITIERKNYVLFSFYTVDGTDGVDFYQYKCVGILGTFFGRMTMIT